MSKAQEHILFAVRKGYKVTKDGRVFYGDVERVLFKNKEGRKRFTVRINKLYLPSIPVHRLQAYQKFGHKIFESGIQVRHLDNDCSNNHWDNIEIGTQSENCMDEPAEIRHARALHAGRANIKYNAEAVRKDRESGMSLKDLMKKHNIVKSTLWRILNNKVL